MAKTLVIDSLTGSRIPFLRGILTRSLQDSGMPFEDAYELASQVRDRLARTNKITSLEIRAMVARLLAEQGHKEIIKQYSEKLLPTGQITILAADGKASAFSKSEYRRYLVASGLGPEQARIIFDRFLDSLIKSGRTEFPAGYLDYQLYKLLLQDADQIYANNYLVWRDFQASGRPLLLLIGGTTGTGKSTIATEIAHRLDIVRTQSTDMLREVMRMMLPARLLPILHTSSFNAWQSLPKKLPDRDIVSDEILQDGFNTQAELLATTSEAVINRALRERVSLILEGVHIRPSFLERIPPETDAAVVMFMLAVLKPEQLKDYLQGRSQVARDRRAQRYLENFDSIWRVQSYLLAEADRCQVPIVINDQKDRVLAEIMRVIVSELSKNCNATPEEVFQVNQTEK